MDALLIYDSKKLPPEIQQLYDLDRPLPPGSRFFEERFTFADLAKQFAFGIILVLLGVLLLVVSSVILFHLDRYSASYDTMSKFLGGADIVALIMLGCSYFMLKSLWPTYQFIRRQARGLGTRQGIFLAGDLLVYNNDDVSKVVPKAFFKGLKDRQVEFEYEGQIKSFQLPSKLVKDDVQSLDTAVANWAA